MESVLNDIRTRGDSFIIEQDGEQVARLSPWPASGMPTLGEALRTWTAEPADPAFADDLERVDRADPFSDPMVRSGSFDGPPDLAERHDDDLYGGQ